MQAMVDLSHGGHLPSHWRCFLSTHSPPYRVLENDFGGLPQFLPPAGEDSVKVTVKFVGKGKRF
jgi:hypothetical protein